MELKFCQGWKTLVKLIINLWWWTLMSQLIDRCHYQYLWLGEFIFKKIRYYRSYSIFQKYSSATTSSFFSKTETCLLDLYGLMGWQDFVCLCYIYHMMGGLTVSKLNVVLLGSATEVCYVILCCTNKWTSTLGWNGISWSNISSSLILRHSKTTKETN